MKPAYCLLTALSLAVCGCGGVKAVMVDYSGIETKVRKLRLEHNHALKIRHNGTMRLVELRDVERIEFIPESSRVHERDLYFPAKVTLSGVGKLEPAPEHRNSDTTVIDVFVCVNDVLTGTSRAGTVRIPLDYIRKLMIR